LERYGNAPIQRIRDWSQLVPNVVSTNLFQGYNFAGRGEIPAGVRFGSTNGEKDRSEYLRSHCKYPLRQTWTFCRGYNVNSEHVQGSSIQISYLYMVTPLVSAHSRPSSAPGQRTETIKILRLSLSSDDFRSYVPFNPCKQHTDYSASSKILQPA
jgi:hypothetical protein